MTLASYMGNPSERQEKMKNHFTRCISFCILFASLLLAGCGMVDSNCLSEKDAVFSFEAVADMRHTAGAEYQSSQYFLGACQAIRDVGKGSFMISPGDVDPPQEVYDTIKKVLGYEYPWYPVAGNHETETPEDMVWLRNWAQKGIANLVRSGPENGEQTTYSFDFKNAHFVAINQYYDGNSDIGCDGDVADALYEWLKNDLELNTKPMVFVMGHEPMVAMPDSDSGRVRHVGDSLDAHPENNHRFSQLLRKHKVQAYFCGHTHNYSSAKINGLWQIDVGHSRGIEDKGAKSTFLKVWVGTKMSWIDVYRDDANGGDYSLRERIVLE
jgi:hypothetical protein